MQPKGEDFTLNSDSIGTPPYVHLMNIKISENCKPYKSMILSELSFRPTIFFKHQCNITLIQTVNPIFRDSIYKESLKDKLHLGKSNAIKFVELIWPLDLIQMIIFQVCFNVYLHVPYNKSWNWLDHINF